MPGRLDDRRRLVRPARPVRRDPRLRNTDASSTSTVASSGLAAAATQRELRNSRDAIAARAKPGQRSEELTPGRHGSARLRTAVGGQTRRRARRRDDGTRQCRPPGRRGSTRPAATAVRRGGGSRRGRGRSRPGSPRGSPGRHSGRAARGCPSGTGPASRSGIRE
jgi:hypothetical protein